MTSFDRYEYRPGKFLEKGDFFRASQGPYFLCDSGRKVSMAVRGKLKFDSLVIDNNDNQIVYALSGLGSLLPLFVLKSDSSAVTEGFVYRPYKLTKVRK